LSEALIASVPSNTALHRTASAAPPSLVSFQALGGTRTVGSVPTPLRRSYLRFWRLLSALALVVPQISHAQQSADPRVADLVRVGRVRIALFSGQYVKDPATGELKGVWADVARAFAARVGVQLVLVEHPTPPEMVECLKTGLCDVGFLGYDPARAPDVEGFSPPFVEFDYTYLVPAGSPIRGATDADRPGTRVAVVRAHASTLTLTRLRKHAELVSVDTPDSAFDLLRSERVDAWASARQVLLDYSARLPGSHVLEDRYGVNCAAVVVAKGQTARLTYISEFIEEIKGSGFVQEAIRRAGWRRVRVAPTPGSSQRSTCAVPPNPSLQRTTPGHSPGCCR
jgi:polar amino acid transport system substrate-binding protein